MYKDESPGSQQGLLFDAAECIGFGNCYEACKKVNKLPETNKDFLKDHLSNNTYTVVEEYGNMYARKMCMHAWNRRASQYIPLECLCDFTGTFIR